MKRKKLMKGLKCDELCFISSKEEVKEQAEEEMTVKGCKPCFER